MIMLLYLGRTSLHFNGGNGHFAEIKYLVDHDANINTIDGDWKTPLHLKSSKMRQSTLLRKIVFKKYF